MGIFDPDLANIIRISCPCGSWKRKPYGHLVIPTNEELQIARETLEILQAD